MSDEEGEQRLPEGWDWTTIGQVASTLSGGTPDRAVPKYYKGDIPWLKSGELEDNLVTEVEEHITAEGLKHSSAKVFPKNTVVVALYGATVGKTAILGLDTSTNQAICAVVPRAEVFSPKYMFYWLQSQRQTLLGKRAGGAQPNINQSIVQNLPFPLAPFAEQQRIVAEIEKQLTRLDAGVAGLNHAHANLRRYHASVLKAACEGRLVAQDPNDEPASILLERIQTERRVSWEAAQRAKGKDPQKQAYPQPASPDTASLPLLPEGWVWTTLDAVGEVQGGIQKQPSRNPNQNAYPYLRVENVLRGRLNLKEVFNIELFGNELEKLRLQSEDLLIVEGNGSRTEIGRCALWRGEIENCVHQNHIIRVRTPKLSAIYASQYLNSPQGIAQMRAVASSTSGLYTLSVSKIKSIVLPLPPLAEQQRIVAEVERRLSVVDELQATITANLKRAGRLRQAILKRAFSGKLVPQDHNDEPASVLLACIREQRAEAGNTAGEKKTKRSAAPKAKRRSNRAAAGQGRLL